VNAVAADLVTSAERGKYVSYASVTIMLSPSVAPIIGGVLAQYAGWRWIFWLLTILALVEFIPFLLFFPETSRKIVGNGTLSTFKGSTLTW
jgi:MFS family permease